MDGGEDVVGDVVEGNVDFGGRDVLGVLSGVGVCEEEVEGEGGGFSVGIVEVGECGDGSDVEWGGLW